MITINSVRNTEEQIRKILHSNQDRHDKVDEKYAKKIRAKLMAGVRLTPKEMAYIRANDPELYEYAKVVETMRKSVENQLENCKSKEEVQDIATNTIPSSNSGSVLKDMIASALKDAVDKFKETDSYKSLPVTKKEAEGVDKDSKNKLETGSAEKDKTDTDNTDGGNGNTDGTQGIQYQSVLGQYQEAYAGNPGNDTGLNLLS